MTAYERVITKPGYKIILVAALIATGMTIDYHEPKPEPLDIVVVPITPMEKRIVDMMKKENSPQPEAVAKAIAKHSRPRLLAAVAAVESNGTPHAKGKKGEEGIFQVTPGIWGKVPPAHDIQGQTDQAAAILESLIAEENGRLVPALSRYNGDRSGKYAKKVMAKVEGLK